MSNIDMVNGWIVLDTITERFAGHAIDTDTRLDALPDGRARIPELHAALAAKFRHGMPALELLQEAETVGQFMSAVVSSVAAWRRFDRVRHLAGKPKARTGFFRRIARLWRRAA